MGPCIVIIIPIYIQRDATLHSLFYLETGTGVSYTSIRSDYSDIQRDATLHSLFYLETALHVSDGTSTHPQERKQLYLQQLLLVTP